MAGVGNATRVLVVRHGETAWNVASRIQGHLDIPLNDTGRQQAASLARALLHENIRAVYSSDLLRATETAQAVALALGLTVVRDPGLRERSFGEFEGHTFDEIAERSPGDALRWRNRDPDYRVGATGESLKEFFARCVGTAARLAALHTGKTIALVAHGGVMDCLYRAATRVDLQAPRSWSLANAAINRLLYTAEGFTLVGWNDTQHLDGTGPLDEHNDRIDRAV